MQEKYASPRAYRSEEIGRYFAPAMLGACLVWALVSWISSANLDSQNDMLENYAWAHEFVLGTHKHPPFFAWVVNFWFELFPVGELSYRLLSYCNVAVGLWGVMVLGQRLGLQRLALWGALLLLWSFPYTTLAGKFNANSQLLSVWPWAAALLLASWQEKGVRGFWFSTWLGIVAAACMLSKYYSGVFLVGFLLPIFLHAQGRSWLKSYRPYWALVVFALALSPHLWWVAQHDWSTLSYVREQGDGHVNWRYVLRFALSPFFYWLPAWLAICAMFAYAHSKHGPHGYGATFRTLLWRVWLPQGKDDVVFWLALMPWALTLLCGMLGLVTLSTPWAIPIGYAFGLLWLRNLQAFDASVSDLVCQRLRASWPWVVLGVALLGVVQTLLNALRSDESYYLPTEKAATEIVQAWSERHPGQQLAWVGGEWTNNALVAFYVLHDQVRTVPDTPDSWAATIEGMRSWEKQHGILFCPLGLAAAAADPQNNECVQKAQKWLGDKALATQPHILVTQKEGWRFPKPLAFAYAIFDVPPMQVAQ